MYSVDNVTFLLLGQPQTVKMASASTPDATFFLLHSHSQWKKGKKMTKNWRKEKGCWIILSGEDNFLLVEDNSLLGYFASPI